MKLDEANLITGTTVEWREIALQITDMAFANMTQGTEDDYKTCRTVFSVTASAQCLLIWTNLMMLGADKSHSHCHLVMREGGLP